MKRIVALLLALSMVFVLGACKAKEKIEAAIEQAEKTIVVGYTIYEPMNFLNDDGDLVGFDTELAEAVFGNLGYTVVFKEIKWENKYTDLDSGAINCIWNGFTANVPDQEDGIARADKVDFSYNYMENLQVVVARKDAGIATAEDLKGKIAFVESGSAGETYATGFEGVADVKGVKVQTECLREASASTNAFAVVDAQLAKSYAGQGNYENLMIVENLSSDVEYYAIGFEKGSELTAQVNAELEKLAEDGTIAELAEKYGVETSVITDFSSQK